MQALYPQAREQGVQKNSDDDTMRLQQSELDKSSAYLAKLQPF